MKASKLAAHVLFTVGSLALIVGAIDPLEGCFVILPGSALLAAGAWLAGSRHRKLFTWTLGLIAIGVAAMVGLSWWGGVGGKTGHSLWWLVLILPYPAGWFVGLTAIVLRLVELFRRGAESSPCDN